jgi:hypothetical protein
MPVFSYPVRPENISLFARAPVRCEPSRAMFFGLLEVRDRVATLHGRCPLRDNKPPVFTALPGLVRRFATAPGFVCPCCGIAGGGLFVPGREHAGNLLHSCVAPYQAESCACRVIRSVPFIDCIIEASAPLRRELFTVRGELVAPPFIHRDDAPAPPVVSALLSYGGGRIVK